MRAVPVEPESDTASSSASDSSSQLPMARDRCQRFSQNDPPREREIVGRPIQAPRHGTRLQRYVQRKRRAASGSTYGNTMSLTQAGPSRTAERMNRVVVDADEPPVRQNFNRESRSAPMDVHNAERPGSPSSRPVDPPTRGRSDERWQGSQRGPAGAVPSSSRVGTSHTAIPHREARPAGMSTETRRQFCESPGAALSQSAKTSHSTGRVSRLPRIDQGVPENATRTYGWPLTSSPAQIRRADIESEGSNSPSFYLQALWLTSSLILTQLIPPGVQSLRL